MAANSFSPPGFASVDLEFDIAGPPFSLCPSLLRRNFSHINPTFVVSIFNACPSPASPSPVCENASNQVSFLSTLEARPFWGIVRLPYKFPLPLLSSF